MNNNECFITQSEKTNLVQDLFLYYSIHNHNLKNVKSHLVIRDLRI